MNFILYLSIFIIQLGLFFSENGIAANIGHIKIEGQKKIEADAILVRIKSKEGALYSPEQIRDDVISLFDLGYFNNIEVHKEGSGPQVDLVFKVVEKPAISEIIYEGNNEIKDEDLAEATGLKAFQIISMNKVRESQEKIQKQYEEKGYFLAKIEPRLEDVVKDETQRLIFDIKENDKIKVKKIRFIGNKKLKDDFLKERMGTKEGGFFSFMSGSGAYKQDAFERDAQMLRFLYFNEGYVQVKIDRPQVYVTPDKKGIYITIRVDEGEQFNVGEIDFAGDLLFTTDELRETIQIDEKKIFAYEVLQKDLSELTAKYGDLGYAFANVIPRTKIIEAEKKVDITFEFDKGNKVYFGKINVVGNTKTRDKVVRRELKILEGELYNETRKRESLENIQRLGFFEDVSFKTSTPPESPDVLNIDAVVKERNTGSIQLGAGYSSSQGFTFYGQVNQSNFLGKGQKLGASLNVNTRGSYYNFNFTEPYFNDTDWSLGGDIYQSISDRYDYSQKVTGGAIRVGHPLSENVTGYLRYRLDNTKFTPEKDAATGADLTDYTLFPLDSAKGVTSSITATVEYDKRNDRFSPSKGLYLSGSLEYAGIGGDLKYLKGTSSFRYFQKIFWDVVWRNNISYATLQSQGGHATPFNELYLLGGAYSLRGFQNSSVGKRVFSQKRKDLLTTAGLNAIEAEKRSWRPFGGAKQLYYTAELEFPLIAEAGIKGVTFYDIGEAEDEITNKNFFSDVGFGLRWFSPIGPLRFEWGFPLNRNTDYHDPMNFEFSIGTPF